MPSYAKLCQVGSSRDIFLSAFSLCWNMHTVHASILKHMTCFWFALKLSETCFTWLVCHLENYMFTGSNRILWDMFPPSQTPIIPKTCRGTTRNLPYFVWKMQHARTMFFHFLLLASMRHVFVPANVQPGTCLVPHFEQRPISCFLGKAILVREFLNGDRLWQWPQTSSFRFTFAGSIITVGRRLLQGLLGLGASLWGKPGCRDFACVLFWCILASSGAPRWRELCSWGPADGAVLGELT